MKNQWFLVTSSEFYFSVTRSRTRAANQVGLSRRLLHRCINVTVRIRRNIEMERMALLPPRPFRGRRHSISMRRPAQNVPLQRRQRSASIDSCARPLGFGHMQQFVDGLHQCVERGIRDNVAEEANNIAHNDDDVSNGETNDDNANQIDDASNENDPAVARATNRRDFE